MQPFPHNSSWRLGFGVSPEDKTVFACGLLLKKCWNFNKTTGANAHNDLLAYI